MDDGKGTADEQSVAPETPEDVAILFSWANLPNARYRDFSASRREYRAQQRAQAAEARRQSDLHAAQLLEAAAQRELQAAERQVAEVRETEESAVADVQAAQHRILAQQRAAAERHEALQRKESAEHQRVLADRARQDMLDARQRAEEQAARYAEASAQREVYRREANTTTLPGEITDPYHYAGHVDPAVFAPTPGVRTAQAARASAERSRLSDTVPSLQSPSFLEERARLAADQHVLSGMQEAQDSPGESQVPEAAADDAYYDHQPALSRRHGEEPLAQREASLPKEPSESRHSAPFRRGQGSSRTTAPFRPAPGAGFVPEHATMPHYRPSHGVAFRSSLLAKTSRAQDQPFSGNPFHAAAGRGLRDGLNRPERLQKLPQRTGVPHASSTRSREHEARLRAIRFVEATEGEERTCRFPNEFRPSPRRRSSDAQTGEPIPAKAEQPAAPGIAERLRLEEIVGTADATPDRYESGVVQSRPAEPSVANGPTKKTDDSGLAPAAPVRVSPAAPTSPMQWRAASRMAQTAFARRRSTSAVPVARTVRQPRTAPVPAPETAAMKLFEAQQAPPAWLSTERAAVRRPAATATAPAPARVAFAEEATEERTASHTHVSEVDPAGPDDSQDAEAFARVGTAESGDALMEERWRGAADLRTLEALGTPSDTLQQSRERVASRWFALSGLMRPDDRLRNESRPALRSGATAPAPVLCVFSLSGGVGKTSIVATLGRALSSMGESVLVADTQRHGILAYYFGAREQKPDVARTFLPPPGSTDAPVVLVSYDSDGDGKDEAAQTRVLDDLERRSQQSQRVLLDVGASSAWLARAVAGRHPWILVPIAPDMNSVLGTRALEHLFADVTDAEGSPVRPYYVLNQYDTSLPLHLDVREVLRRYLGDRLLPIMLHRTPAVAEALAEGMTIMDYAPDSAIAEDYTKLAAWVRRLTDPAMARNPHWSTR